MALEVAGRPAAVLGNRLKSGVVEGVRGNPCEVRHVNSQQNPVQVSAERSFTASHFAFQKA